MIRRTTRSLTPEPTMPKISTPHTPTSPSSINVSHFPTEGWLSHTRPTKCVVSGRIGTIIGYEEYYIKDDRVLCTCAFLTAAVTTTIDDGASPPESTKLDNETGHNCKMPHKTYRSFTRLVLGLDHDTWAQYCTEGAFCTGS